MDTLNKECVYLGSLCNNIKERSTMYTALKRLLIFKELLILLSLSTHAAETIDTYRN